MEVKWEGECEVVKCGGETKLKLENDGEDVEPNPNLDKQKII